MTLAGSQEEQVPAASQAGGSGRGFLVAQLPRPMASDPFLERMLYIFEDVIEDVRQAVAASESVVDPALTPPEFLSWLASWQSLVPPALLPEVEYRDLIARGGRLNRRRGTAAGLRGYLQALTQADVEIEDGGGVFRSDDDILQDDPVVTVRVASTRGMTVEEFTRLVADQIPAWATLRVEVTGDG